MIGLYFGLQRLAGGSFEDDESKGGPRKRDCTCLACRRYFRLVDACPLRIPFRDVPTQQHRESP